MTLHDFLQIFRTEAKLFWWVAIVLFATSWLAFRLQNESYTTSLFLTVTRSGKDATTEYRYHQFYRLQADERFADSLVRYLSTPQAKADLAKRADLSLTDEAFFLGKPVSAKRLSSNIIALELSTRTRRAGEIVAQTIAPSVNSYIETLNFEAREPDWFQVLASAPEVGDARVNLRLALLGGLAGSLFVAFWSVLLKVFWKGSTKKDELC